MSNFHTGSSSTGKWFKFHEGEKPLRNMSAYVIFEKEERPKLCLEFPNMSFREGADRISARFQALTPTQREKYTKMSQLEMERYIRETLEWKNAQLDKERYKWESLEWRE
uniref:HMG box domain-containing protein n=1 Tax=Chaetoceros debilis TaxID=122233 RepID=A0A7S3QGZ6_9STRA